MRIEVAKTSRMEEHAGPDASPPLVRARAAGVFLVALLAYLANGRELGTYDTEPTTLTAFSLLHGDGVSLDRFQIILREEDGSFVHSVSERRGMLVSRYPTAAALLAAVILAPEKLALDHWLPGWNADAETARRNAKTMGKHAASAIAAATSALAYLLLARMGFRRAGTAALAAALGSNMWMISSQALWQHGSAAFALTGAMLLLTPRDCFHRRPKSAAQTDGIHWLALVFGGIAAGFLIAVRLVDAVFSAALLAWTVRHERRRSLWFLVGFAPIVSGLACWNYWLFDSPLGGQVELERLHGRLHQVAGPWSGDLLNGIAGTLASPSRGLFIYTPWVLVSLLLLPATARRIPEGTPARWLIAVLPICLLIFSKYAVWWGGHSFGPRYWTEATPIFAVLLAAALDWSSRRKLASVLLGATIAYSAAVQALGAFHYTGSWNRLPRDVDRHTERLWQWKDCELLRTAADAVQ